MNNLSNNKIIGKIVQAGAVGLCILLIGLLGYVFKLFYDFTSNHLQESIKIQQELKGSVESLDKAIERLIETINRNREIKSI